MRGEPAAAEASMTLHQPEARRVFSRGNCPRIMGPWQWWAAQSPRRGGVDSDLCLHTGFLVAAAAALSSHAHLSALIAAARACLWSSFKRLFGSSRPFPGLPPSQLWHTSPLQAVFTQPTPILSLGSDLQSLSLSSQPPPALAAEQTSLSGW